MKYYLDKEAFAKLLCKRPTLIKKVNLENIDLIAYLVKHAREPYEFLPLKLQRNINIVRAYIFMSKEERRSRSDYAYPSSVQRSPDFSNIPTPALNELTETERIDLIKRSYQIITRFSNTTFNEWVVAARLGIDFKELPKEHYGRKELWEAMVRHLEKYNTSPEWEIPEVFWQRDKNAEKALLSILEFYPEFIQAIPSKRITSAMLRIIFQSGSTILLKKEKFSSIPREAWNERLVSLALKADASNIQTVPLNFITKKTAIAAADVNVSIKDIPPTLMCREVRAHIAAHYHPFLSHGYVDDPDEFDPQFFKDLKDPTFQIEVAKLKNGVKNIHRYIKPDNRIAVLKACPVFLEYIPKLEQTDEIINTFLQNADPEEIDKVCKFINLGKIKRKHAPLLIGCEKQLILTTIEKKLKGTPRKKNTEVVQTKKTSVSVEIDIPPTEYAKILDQINKNTL